MTVRTVPLQEQRAVRRAMRYLRDDDLARGISRAATRWCDRCRAVRPAAGAIAYHDAALCHVCAVGYELARLRGTTRSACDYAGAIAPAAHSTEPQPTRGRVPR